jgi:gliding motility-associated-like protein
LQVAEGIEAAFDPPGGEYDVRVPIQFTDLSIGATTWQWDFADGQSAAIQHPVHTFLTSGLYNVMLVAGDNAGCKDTLFHAFAISESQAAEAGGPIAVPTAFTPDGDGLNDILYVRGGPFRNMEFRIYNEWGNEVFATQDPQAGWDGTYKGKKQPAGTYVWVLWGTTVSNTEINRKGSVTILK